MSIEAIAARAAVGKTTIYRWYDCKAELVADALENVTQGVTVPDTGSLWGDLDQFIENAANSTLNPLSRNIIALIINTASSSPQFAQVYWTKYMQPRREAFVAVLERAKSRYEVQVNLDSYLTFDLMSGAMLYALIFYPAAESWKAHVRGVLEAFLRSSVD
jgi:AcrR family transcriptional regulator